MNSKIPVLLILIIIAISSIIISVGNNMPNVSTNKVSGLITPSYFNNTTTYYNFTSSSSYSSNINDILLWGGARFNVTSNIPENLISYEISVDANITPNYVALIDGSITLNGQIQRYNWTVMQEKYNYILFPNGSTNINVNYTVLPQFLIINSGVTNYQFDFLPDYLQSTPTSFNYISQQWIHNSTSYVVPDYNISLLYSATQTAGYLYSLNTYMHSFIMKYNNVNVTPVYYIFNFLGNNYTSTKEGTNIVNTTYIFYLNITVPNGTYYYMATPVIEYQSFSNGLPIYQYIPMTNYSVSGYFIISGSNFNLNVTNPVPLINYKQIYFYAYLVISGLLIMAVLKLSNGLIMAYSMSASLFMLIGYKLNLPFFNTSLIMTVITLISGMFVYLYIWSEK
jgi:hypothetical protein